MFKIVKCFFDCEDMLDDDKVVFYIGLLMLKILDVFYGYIVFYIIRWLLIFINYQEFVMVLMKLRFDMLYCDLVY